VRINRISGHRDVDQTACPGSALYAQLPALRKRVRKLEGATSALTLDPAFGAASYGSGPAVTGTLAVPEGASPAGATVELRALTGRGPERALATATTAADGSWSAQLPPFNRPELVRAVFMGDEGRPGVASRPSFFALLPRITLSAGVSGATVTAGGTVKPSKKRVTVVAYLQKPGGGERRAASKQATVKKGRYKARLTLDRAGAYRLVTSAAADARSGAGSSPPTNVQVAPAE
jgi:hypothetical protein